MMTDLKILKARWRENALEQALIQLGQGIIMLSDLGEVMFMTNVAELMLKSNDGLAILDNKLIAVNQQDNQRLKAILHEILIDELPANCYKSLYLHRTSQSRPFLLLVSKVKFEVETDKNADSGILIIIKDTHANNIYWLERLKQQYRLTNREADFAVLLTEGRSIKEISLVMEIAEETARQYLKNCFKKMDVQKQHELVCLALDYSRKR